jgi:hypothetical protein
MFFHISNKRSDVWNKVIEHKMRVLIFSTTFAKKSLILTRIQRDIVGQWLRHCATTQKVAGSIPDGVIEIFH